MQESTTQSKPHRESLETKEYIAKWAAKNFFFSLNDEWGRMGMLGVFGDYVLSSLPGNILEIGCGESSIYLSSLALKYRRHSYHCDIAPSKILNPLTVPGYIYPQAYFPPEGQAPKCLEFSDTTLFMGPSDEFFRDIRFLPIALAFIDGDHIYEQVKKDFENTVKLVQDNGFILLHDTYPPSEEYLDENRCGTVYRLRQEIEKDPRFDCMTLVRGTAIDVGLTIVRKKPLNLPEYQQ